MPTFDPTTIYSSNIVGDGLIGLMIPGAGDVASTVTEYFDLPFWARDPKITSVGLPLDPGEPPPFEPTPIVADRENLWTFEIRDSADVFIENVEDWVKLPSEPLRMVVDEASTAGFRLKSDSSHVANLVPPNRVWLRDWYGFYAGTYEIGEAPGTRNMDETWRDYYLEDALVQLGREPVVHFVRESQSVITTVQELLDAQRQSPPIVLGQIDAAIADYEAGVEFSDTTILGALRTLQAEMPATLRGYFFIDSHNTLQWRNKIGRDAGETLTVGEGLNGVEFGVSYRDLTTEVHMYGRGKDHRTRVKLTDVGADEAEEWIQSAAGVSSYGIRPRLIVDRRFKYPESLLAYAKRFLEEFDHPEVSTGISEVIQVSKADGDRFEESNDLYPGSRYRIVDDALGIDITVFVRSIEYELDNPLPVKMEMTNRRRSLASALSYMQSQISEPLDVMDGSEDDNVGRRYPKIGRNIGRGDAADDATYPNLGLQNGDWSHDGATPGTMGYWDETIGDWVPVAIIYRVDTLVELPNLASILDGAIGYVKDDDLNTGAWVRHESEWHPMDGIYREETLAALPNLAAILDGAIGYVTNDGINDGPFVRDNSEWAPIDGIHRAETLAGLPNLAAAKDGARGYVLNDGANTGPWVRFESDWRRSVLSFETQDATAPKGSIAVVGNRPELKRGDGAWKSPTDVN